MLKDNEREAVARWYSEPHVLEEAKSLFDAGAYDELEEHLHKTCLFPLGKHNQLPNYMRKEDGSPLFKTNLSPLADEELWRDAIEIGWEVVEEKLGFCHDDIHKGIAASQKDDWQAFIDSVERRKRERKER